MVRRGIVVLTDEEVSSARGYAARNFSHLSLTAEQFECVVTLMAAYSRQREEELQTASFLLSIIAPAARAYRESQCMLACLDEDPRPYISARYREWLRHRNMNVSVEVHLW